MADRVGLWWLTFSIRERTAQFIAALTAYHVHRVPEIGSPELICNILQHAYYLAAFDLVEALAAELGIVALLIDREGSIADDRDATIGRRDEIFPFVVRFAWKQRDVRHALELDVLPTLSVRAAV